MDGQPLSRLNPEVHSDHLHKVANHMLPLLETWQIDSLRAALAEWSWEIEKVCVTVGARAGPHTKDEG